MGGYEGSQQACLKNTKGMLQAPWRGTQHMWHEVLSNCSYPLSVSSKHDLLWFLLTSRFPRHLLLHTVVDRPNNPTFLTGPLETLKRTNLILFPFSCMCGSDDWVVSTTRVQKSKSTEVLRSQGIQNYRQNKASYGCWEWNPGPLQEHWGLLTTGQFLQLLWIC